MKLFVSHASLDREVATDVAERIRGEGFDVWMAEREVRGGQDFAEEIMRGLDECDGFVLLLTSNSNGSPHVKNEVNQAVGRKLPILPLLIERFEVSRTFAYYLAHVQWVDASGGIDGCWGHVVDVLGDWQSNRRPECRNNLWTSPQEHASQLNSLENLDRRLAAVRNDPIRRADIFGAVVLATAGAALPLICGRLLHTVDKALYEAGWGGKCSLLARHLYRCSATLFALGSISLAVVVAVLCARPALAEEAAYMWMMLPCMVVASSGFAGFSVWFCAEGSRLYCAALPTVVPHDAPEADASARSLRMRIVKAQAACAVLLPLSYAALVVSLRSALVGLANAHVTPTMFAAWLGLIIGIAGCLHMALTGSAADLITEVIAPQDNLYSLRNYLHDVSKRSPGHWCNVHFTWPAIYIGQLLCVGAVVVWAVGIWEG